MPTLHDIQRGFTASLLGGGDGAIEDWIVGEEFTAAERLRVYRNSSRSVATDVLRMTYPAVDRLVGREFFDMAAERFYVKYPPGSGYLNEYGCAFADFLSALPEAAAFCYLPDAARFEWALNWAANANDAPVLDLASLAAVSPEQHANLRFVPHPSVQLLELEYPADVIADAVIADDENALTAIDLASGPVLLIVNRGPNGVDAQRLPPGGYEFACPLFAGGRLGEALKAAGPDGAAYLAGHFVNGRLTQFYTESETRDG